MLVPTSSLSDGLTDFDWLFLSGATEIVQLLREGEGQPAAAGQARNEHFERHAGDSKLGKECGLQKIMNLGSPGLGKDISVLGSDEMDLWPLWIILGCVFSICWLSPMLLP